MKIQTTIVLLFSLFLLSCTGGQEEKPDSVQSSNLDDYILISDSVNSSVIQNYESRTFDEIINSVELRILPVNENTNFDNFSNENFLTRKDVETLKIEQIYPSYFFEGSNYKSVAIYKISLSEKFHSIVITTIKGDHEIESNLINYDFNGNLIDFLMISYDEIAEGWIYYESLIEKEKVVVTDVFWSNEKQETVNIFELDDSGKFKKSRF